MTKKSVRRQGFDTDITMKTLWLKLVRDFRTVQGPGYNEASEIALLQGIKKFRLHTWPGRFKADPYLFRQEVQLENLFKRYRFKNDLHNDSDLSRLTYEKFAGLQQRLATVSREAISQSTFMVVQRARGIIKTILTEPPGPNRVGRFSTRATVGCPASDAYLDHKLAGPITGTREHLRWFDEELHSDPLLKTILEKCAPPGGPLFTEVDSLPLIGVPKSYKSERLIQPNTLVGSLYTDWLGKLIVLALRRAGIDLRYLQGRHRVLARRYSRTRTYVTADMSAASESYLSWLLNMLLPREWYRAVARGRAKFYDSKGGKQYYFSFMAMGIGFTFPLQTLLFYALLRAIRELLEIDGFESVFGDDLIYDRRIHPIVERIFSQLGFTLNKDKTFVESFFRESCGGDYYHGVDVRPFSPEGRHQLLGHKRYEAWLYKLYNGLTRRWSLEEIPQTIHYLRTEILRATSAIKQVPPSYPDTSGVQVSKPYTGKDREVLLGFSPVKTFFSDGSRQFEFALLVEVPKRRFVSFVEPYYWNKLRTAEDGALARLSASEEYVDDESRFDMYADSTEELIWVKKKYQPRNYRDVFKRRISKTVAMTTCKLSTPKIQSSTGQVYDWT